MGWRMPWYSLAGNGFNDDCGIGNEFGLSVFFRDDKCVFRTYFTNGRGVEALGSNWTLLDLTPLGRQEEWEDSPEGFRRRRVTAGGGATTTTTERRQAPSLASSQAA
jgi:predicted dithiol-disulfide oxidoreductase (DUF899 family)